METRTLSTLAGFTPCSSSSSSSNRNGNSKNNNNTRFVYPFNHRTLTKPRVFSVLKTSSRPHVSEVVEDDVLLSFLKERKENGDFISKASDIFWQRISESLDSHSTQDDAPEQVEEEVNGDDEDDGFLKLSRTHEWVSGVSSVPLNKKGIAKAYEDDRDKRKKLNLLRYEALKREMLFVSVGIGGACTGYCLLVFSVQAAISYAVGVLFSCLYLKLLYQHTDSLSREDVPYIFRQKKRKKIGIKSEDLKDTFERSVKGSAIALSSPRLVIPAAIYGLWILSHQFANDLLDFQLTPAMVGLFVYKAAALVQVYRDNEDLQYIFPEDDQVSND